jgi:hypothetical protein
VDERNRLSGFPFSSFAYVFHAFIECSRTAVRDAQKNDVIAKMTPNGGDSSALELAVIRMSADAEDCSRSSRQTRRIFHN